MLTIITPTSDRCEGMCRLDKRLCEVEVPFRWIIADDGHCKWGATRILKPIYARCQPGNANPTQSFRSNLLRAIPKIPTYTEFVLIAEDDDWYHPNHFADMVRRLQSGVLAAGDTQQRYYHLPSQSWKQFTNRGACLAQTAFRTELLPLFHQAIINPDGDRGVDAAFWKSVMQSGLPYDLFNGDDEGTPYVVGMKGLPGKAGIGLGHNPDKTWTDDADFVKLRQWTGDDADTYIQLARKCHGRRTP